MGIGFRRGNSVSALFLVCLLSACNTTTKDIPKSKYLLPNATLRITPQIGYTVEQIALAAAVAGAAYLVYDPLAPNWTIEEEAVSDDIYRFSLRSKNFRVGGDGESLRILRRRALFLQQERGFLDYRLVDYSEGIDSSTPLTSRFSEGTIQFIGRRVTSPPEGQTKLDPAHWPQESMPSSSAASAQRRPAEPISTTPVNRGVARTGGLPKRVAGKSARRCYQPGEQDKSGQKKRSR
ncbi:MAG: hypothetical protein LBD67_10385 [Candidatus Accumulibacter sp.]|jgi:hypothetical protein|nr:hypothetical protein [Accumulibacter sp.]